MGFTAASLVPDLPEPAFLCRETSHDLLTPTRHVKAFGLILECRDHEPNELPKTFH
jgi:hypothetical protein